MEERPAPDPAEWCAQRIGNSDDYFLSTYTLWQEYRAQYSRQDLDYKHFEQLLRSDKRLHVTAGFKEQMSTPQQEVLSNMGFPTHALVGLASRHPSREELDSAIRAKASQLQNALLKAWEARPADSPDVEERLLFLMEQAKKLCDMLEMEHGQAR